MERHRLATGWNAAPAVLLPAPGRFCSAGALGDLCRSEADHEEVRITTILLSQKAGRYCLTTPNPTITLNNGPANAWCEIAIGDTFPLLHEDQ